MDDFLNFFKTSLFWSPIRGCSLKQRLKVNKHSCSNTVNAVLKQRKNKKKKEEEILPQNCYQTSTSQQGAADSEVGRAPGHSEYSLPTVVEVAAVAGVALHTQVAGGARRVTGHLQDKTTRTRKKTRIILWSEENSSSAELEVRCDFLTLRSDAVSLEW